MTDVLRSVYEFRVGDNDSDQFNKAVTLTLIRQGDGSDACRAVCLIKPESSPYLLVDKTQLSRYIYL